VGALRAAREETQDLERADDALDPRRAVDLHLRAFGRLVAGAVAAAHVDLDHPRPRRTRGVGRDRQPDDRRHAVTGERLDDEEGAAIGTYSGEHLGAGRPGVEHLDPDLTGGEPHRDGVRRRLDTLAIRPPDPDGEGHREAHPEPAATPGKRPGRKITLRSFTTSWSFRKTWTACESTFASSARPRAFTSSSASSPTRMWKTSCRTTGPASSCSVTKCAVQPETRTPSSQACL